MRMRVLHSTYVGAFLAAAGLMYVFFLYYTTSSNLRAAEAKLEKLTEINERLTAQQQVVVGHKQRLERSLDEAKERLAAAKEDSDKRYQSLKALKEELQQKLEQEGAARSRVEEDGRRLAEQHSIEYQLLKQEKEAAIAKISNDLNSQKAETVRLQTEADGLQAEATRLRTALDAAQAETTRLQRALDAAQAEARSAQSAASQSTSTAQELRKTIASLEAEVANLRTSAAAAAQAANAAAAAQRPAAASTKPADEPPVRLAVGDAVLAQAAATATTTTAAAAAVRNDPEIAAEAKLDSSIKSTLPPSVAPPAAAVAHNEDINLNDQPHQVVAPLGGGPRERDERVADHADDDDDDGGAGNHDEAGAGEDEEANHLQAHAKPDRQLAIPQGLLVKQLRAAVEGRQQQAAASSAVPPLARAKAHADESMQVGRPPAMDDNSQARLGDQEESKQANRAANNKPDEP